MGFYLSVVAYVAGLLFLGGMIYRFWSWLNAGVPLFIPTTPAPKTKSGIVGTLAAEIFLFRSLLRDKKALWFLSWIFHLALLFILLRHLRYFLFPVPAAVMAVQTIGYYAGFVFALAAFYLLLRRVMDQGVILISLANDYLILLLLLAIATTGLLTRYFAFQDLVHLKHFILGLLAFQPVEAPLHLVFILHYLLVMLLVAYFPFSKLVHAGAVAFNPTRNQRNIPREAGFDPQWDFPVD